MSRSIEKHQRKLYRSNEKHQQTYVILMENNKNIIALVKTSTKISFLQKKDRKNIEKHIRSYKKHQ